MRDLQSAQRVRRAGGGRWWSQAGFSDAVHQQNTHTSSLASPCYLRGSGLENPVSITLAVRMVEG